MIRLGGLVSQKAFGKFEMGKVISNPFANAFVNEAEGEDHEVSMGQNQLDTIIKMATELKAKMGENEKEIPAWIQDHISKAENYISQAAGNYHEYGTNESVNEAFNIKVLPTWLFDDVKDFEYWYKNGMALGSGKGKLAPLNSSDERKLFDLIKKWRKNDPTAQDDIKQLFKQKGKIVKNEANTISAPGQWVAYLSMTRGKKLLKTFDTARGAKQYLSKNVDKLLGGANVESVGIMTKKQWDEREAKYAIESIKEESPCWKGYKQVGMKDKNGRQVPNCVPNESVVNEASRVPKMYVKYMAVQKKVNELEAAQKAMATKYFAEKELNKKAKMLQDLKKGTEQLASYRRNLAAIEDKYITGLYADAEYEGE